MITGIVTAVLGIGGISPDDDLWALGCDSLAAAEIVTKIGSAGFGAVELAGLLDATTPAEIAARVGHPVATAGQSNVVHLNPGGTLDPLWMIAGAGVDGRYRPPAAGGLRMPGSALGTRHHDAR